jgi:hypothetical protein
MRKLLAGSRFAGLGGAAARALAGDAPVVVVADDSGDPATERSEAEPAPDPAPDPAPEPSAEPEPSPEPDPAAEPAGDQSAAASERARVASVFASEHSQGRERMAADMLQTSMSADEITGLLAKAPKGSSADAMLANLATTTNPDLGAGTSAEPTGRKAAASVWDRAAASNGRIPADKKEG